MTVLTFFQDLMPTLAPLMDERAAKSSGTAPIKVDMYVHVMCLTI